MSDFIKFVNNGGAIGWTLIGLGGLGVYLVAERVKALFFDYKIDARAFTDHIKSLVMADKIEEAVSYCSAHPKAPLSHVIKGILERSDRDEDSIHQAVEVKYAEVMPKLRRGFGYLAMLSNVATLVGLLGTIHGLMLSFEAVAFADPSQKSTILTQGIAMYMTDTFLGLAVAIPVMFAYAFLQARQSRLFDEIVESSQKLIDLLSSRSWVAFSHDKAFPDDINAEAVASKKTPPPVPGNGKAAA